MCKYNSISAHFLNIAHFLYGSDVRLYDSPGFKLFILVGWAGASYLLLGTLRFTTFLLTFLLLSKDQTSISAAGVVSCVGRKKSPRYSSIVQSFSPLRLV